MGRRPKQTFLQRRHTDGQQTWKDAQHAHYCCCCSVACHFRLFVIPWTTAYQASLSFTTSLCLLKPISTELVMPSNHLILCHPLFLLPSIFPSIRVFSNELALCISGQSTGASASASVLPMNIQDWFPLALTSLISLLSKRFSRVFSNTTVQNHQFFSIHPSFFMIQLSHPYMTMVNTTALTKWTFISKVISLLFNCYLGLS